MDPLPIPSLSTIPEEEDRLSEDLDDVFVPSLDLLCHSTSRCSSMDPVRREILHEETEAACQEMVERVHRIEKRGSGKLRRLIRETYYKRETRVRIRKGLRSETRTTVRVEETRTRSFHPRYKVTSTITVDQCDQEEPVIVEQAPEEERAVKNGMGKRNGQISSRYLRDTVPNTVC